MFWLWVIGFIVVLCAVVFVIDKVRNGHWNLRGARRDRLFEQDLGSAAPEAFRSMQQHRTGMRGSDGGFGPS
ncbi:hypothetical protein G9U51_05045 [Calidifontibacter sp. DB0510]|uniref:Uncharacterized protein n=1 Tax=Metallococcus carri TaxID=1656884 RepID=A0A967AY57_9MICO|nr:hypothetical protein [Metallococcus carri]NHN55154.1 hypothetical protein [Metallococcus carri]NOP36231.1 hypothetical protein [Calidifontibacter sp. DB2511S]